MKKSLPDVVYMFGTAMMVIFQFFMIFLPFSQKEVQLPTVQYRDNRRNFFSFQYFFIQISGKESPEVDEKVTPWCGLHVWDSHDGHFYIHKKKHPRFAPQYKGIYTRPGPIKPYSISVNIWHEAKPSSDHSTHVTPTSLPEAQSHRYPAALTILETMKKKCDFLLKSYIRPASPHSK